MTKLTFDVDFTKDPEEILREIQEQAKQEVAKRESKEKANAYLANLHKFVNEEIGTSYKSIDDLIRALSAFSKSGSIRGSSTKLSASGRRVTVSMTQQIFDDIKSRLSEPNPNKAAIARETGVSVVQVRKVATGGFDSKFQPKSSEIGQPNMKKPEIISSAVASTEKVSVSSHEQNLAKEPAPLVPSPALSRITSSGSYATFC